MKVQAEQLAKLARGLKAEIKKQEYFDARVKINDHVDVYANDQKDYVHVQFNRGEAKPVDITIHAYNETHYSETMSIDLSITNYDLDMIVKRSQGIVEEFIQIYSNRSEEIKEKKIEELEAEIAKIRGDV